MHGRCSRAHLITGGTLQILLFGLIAIKIKANAPGAHTFPEIILARHGTFAHLSYLFFGIATNMLVGACLVLGGAQVVSAVTSMNVYGACFLIPLVVAAYVIAGGLRSTFIADYVHTLVLFLAIFIFGFSIYATSPLVGSLDRYYVLLQKASEAMPIPTNAHEGSYLTFRSVDGLIFFVDLFVAGFSTVWLDQAYWQRAIASRPESSLKAYLLGGIAWYGIPFGFSTIAGLGCAALTGSPSFPTYPNPLSAEQTGAGLSAPATAITLLGRGGAILMLILLFMAVTSSTSAELIAVSSLLTFDVYKTYVDPAATSHRLVQISHYGIVLYSLVLAAFCCLLNAVGCNLTWILTVLGIIVGGASLPVGLVLLWPRMSSAATNIAPWTALALGLVAWFVTTSQLGGAITVETSGSVVNAVAGNLVSWGSGGVLSVVLTFAFPSKYKGGDLAQRERASKSQGVPPALEAAKEDLNRPAHQQEKHRQSHSDMEASADRPGSVESAEQPTGNTLVDYLSTSYIVPLDPKFAKRSTRIGWAANSTFALIALILVPFTLFGTGYEFNVAFFRGWVVVSFIWVWVSFGICIIGPLIESRREMGDVLRGLAQDVLVLFRVDG